MLTNCIHRTTRLVNRRAAGSEVYQLKRGVLGARVVHGSPRALNPRSSPCLSATVLKLGFAVFATVAFLLLAPPGVLPGTAAETRLSPLWIANPFNEAFDIARRGPEIWVVGNFGIALKKGAAAPWKVVSEAGGAAMMSIAFSPSGAGVCVGVRGTVFTIAPDSDVWKPQKSGTSNRLLSVAASSTGEFVAVGTSGTIIDRPTGSETWKRIRARWPGHNPANLYDVDFVAPARAIAVGQDQAIVTLDKGTITNLNVSQATDMEGASTAPALFALTQCDGELLAAGQSGLLMTRSFNPTWETSRIPGASSIYGLTCDRNQRVIVLGTGRVMEGLRDGSAWQWTARIRRSFGSAGWFAAALPVGPGQFYVAGEHGVWGFKLAGHGN